jgi:hypothetical protein
VSRFVKFGREASARGFGPVRVWRKSADHRAGERADGVKVGGRGAFRDQPVAGSKH